MFEYTWVDFIIEDYSNISMSMIIDVRLVSRKLYLKWIFLKFLHNKVNLLNIFLHIMLYVYTKNDIISILFRYVSRANKINRPKFDNLTPLMYIKLKLNFIIFNKRWDALKYISRTVYICLSTNKKVNTFYINDHWHLILLCII